MHGKLFIQSPSFLPIGSMTTESISSSSSGSGSRSGASTGPKGSSNPPTMAVPNDDEEHSVPQRVEGEDPPDSPSTTTKSPVRTRPSSLSAGGSLHSSGGSRRHSSYGLSTGSYHLRPSGNNNSSSNNINSSPPSASATPLIPSTPVSARASASSKRRLSLNLAERLSKFEQGGNNDSNHNNEDSLVTMSPMHTASSSGHSIKVPLSATGRRRNIRSSLVGRVQVFDSPKLQPSKNAMTLLSPQQVRQLVLSTSKRLYGMVHQYESIADQRKRLHDKASAKQRQRLLQLRRLTHPKVRRKQWEQARAQFGGQLNDYQHRSSWTTTSSSPHVIYQPVRAKLVDFNNFCPPNFGSKTSRQEALIRQVMERCFCFAEFRTYGKARTDGALEALLQAFQVVERKPNEILWHQQQQQKQSQPQQQQKQSQPQWKKDDDDNDVAFTIVEQGTIAFHADGVHVGTAHMEEWFGEQSLLYSSPSTVTVSVALDSQYPQGTSTLLQLTPLTYRGLVHMFTQRAMEEKRQALRGVDFLQELWKGDPNDNDDEDWIRRLASIMTRVEFVQGDVLEAPEDETFYVVQSGELLVENDSGTLQLTLGAEQYFGERALIGSLPRKSWIATQTYMTATSPQGVIFQINRQQMEAILGPRRLQNLQDIHRLSTTIPLIQRAQWSQNAKAQAASLMVEHSCQGQDDTLLLQVDSKDSPALYVVREGTVTVSYDDHRREPQTLQQGDVFGHEDLEETRGQNGHSTIIRRTVGFQATTADGQSASIGVLPVVQSLGLEQADSEHSATSLVPSGSQRSVGAARASAAQSTLALRNKVREVVQSNISLEDLERLSLLGEGEYGEVWLVAADMFQTGDPNLRQKFALKSQLKVDQVRGKDAMDAIRREIQVLEEIDHPQIVDLVTTYEDEDNLYMLMGLIPGGELWDRIHQEMPAGGWTSGLSEADAKFYTLVIADTLCHMHSHQYIFRDLKPENIMIDSDGYPVIVDFGFAKYCPDVTWTFCGTPNYVAPEIITHSGHNRGVDHWALGITLYEMITGENPFFFEGMDPTALYDAICREPHYPLSKDDGRSDRLMDLVDRLLEKDPTQRLGMLVGGMDDILKHPWFDGIDLGQVRAKKWPAPWKPEQSPEEGALADGLVDKLGLNSIPLPSLDESTKSFGDSFASIVEEVHEDSFEVQDDEEEEVKKKPAKSTKSPSKTKKKSKTITKEDFQFVTPMEERRYQPIRDPRKKSSRYSKEQSKTRRSTISETLAGMGIDSDDDYQLF